MNLMSSPRVAFAQGNWPYLASSKFSMGSNARSRIFLNKQKKEAASKFKYNLWATNSGRRKSIGRSPIPKAHDPKMILPANNKEN